MNITMEASPIKHKIIIGLVALMVRLIVSYLFYGSIDVSAFIAINRHTFNDTLSLHPYLIWCSFPVIPFYLWLPGFLSVKTSLPIAFCFKLIPSIFDVLLAVLLYDIAKKLYPRYAFSVGLLYALSPVSLIVTCIHGQWDAVPLFFFVMSLYVREFFHDSYTKYFLYGLLFTFSFLLKPVSLVFIIFFFTPWALLTQVLQKYWLYVWGGVGVIVGSVIALFVVFKTQRQLSLDVILSQACHPYVLMLLLGMVLLVAVMLWRVRPWTRVSSQTKQYLAYQAMSVLGLLVMLACIFSLFALYGFNLMRIVDKVFRYCNQGIHTFGLPMAYPFNQPPLILILKNRFWLMGLLGIVAYAYYNGVFDIFNAVTLSFACIFSFAGLSPQYIVWIIPFLLITGYYRWLAVFNIVFTIFAVLYYMNPLSNPEVPYQSMLSFAALKGWHWIMPPAWLMDVAWLPIIRLLGNYVIPLLCMGITVYMVICARNEHALSFLRVQQPLARYERWYLWVIGIFSAGIAVLMWCADTTMFAPLFDRAIATKETLYDVCTIDHCLCGNYGVWQWGNAVFIMLVLAIAWSVYTYRLRAQN